MAAMRSAHLTYMVRTCSARVSRPGVHTCHASSVGITRRASTRAPRAATTAAGIITPAAQQPRANPSAAAAQWAQAARDFVGARPFSAEAVDASGGDREAQIAGLLREGLSASHVNVLDVSGGCGAMFRIEVVSPQFDGLSLVKQHRMVNEVLKAEIGDMHGLTIKTMTDKAWQKAQAAA